MNSVENFVSVFTLRNTNTLAFYLRKVLGKVRIPETWMRGAWWRIRLRSFPSVGFAQRYSSDVHDVMQNSSIVCAVFILRVLFLLVRLESAFVKS